MYVKRLVPSNLYISSLVFLTLIIKLELEIFFYFHIEHSKANLNVYSTVIMYNMSIKIAKSKTTMLLVYEQKSKFFLFFIPNVSDF